MRISDALVQRIAARMLALEHVLKVHAGEELGAEIIESIDRHLGLERLPEPPGGYTARPLLNDWRVPTAPETW